MIREPWDYDHRSHKVILNVKTYKASKRRMSRGMGMGANLLNRPRLVVLIIMVTILVLLFLKEAKSVLASNPQFIIRNIVFENTNLIDRSAVEDILKLKNQKGLLNVSVNEIVRTLEKDPDIGSVTAEKILPDTLKITVDEKKAFARFIVNGKTYYIDDKGNVLLRERSNASVPVISGLVINKPVAGESCITTELENVLNVIKAGKKAGWDRYIEPIELDVAGNGSITISTREKITIKLKVNNIDDQLVKLIAILNDVQGKNKLVKLVDLRFKDIYIE